VSSSSIADSSRCEPKHQTQVLCLTPLSLDILVWQVRSLIGNAVTVSLMGLFLGPLYPLIMAECAALMPRRILTGSIGWISGFGQMGGALFPFMTGAIANRYGIRTMPPLYAPPSRSCLILYLTTQTASSLWWPVCLSSIHSRSWTNKDVFFDGETTV
jgi:fucose permease